jgi:hypothetical protein
LLEEIITVLLNRYYSESLPLVNFTIEYSEVDSNLNIDVFYQGGNVDIINIYMDEIQKKILVGKCQNYLHSYNNEINKIQLII